ncbi:MAG TPA: hypothetical protein DEO32_06390 [Ruminococcaceae bacterium]|nr:hypothetical protein [Oscillospiraceae bacterium]
MKNKKKLLVLSVFVVLAIIFSFVYVVAVGNHYTLHTNTFLGTEQLPRLKIKLSDDSVVRMADARMENGELVVVFEALNPGKTTVNISFELEDGFVPLHERTFEVNGFHTLFDHTDGVISFNGFQFVVYAALFVLFAVQFMTLWMFSDCWKRGDFSYPMVACGGIGIYNLVLFAYLLYRMLTSYIDSVGILISVVTETGRLLLFGLTPVMLVISVLLAVSNIRLMRNEGKRPVNTLGIIFAALWFIGMVLTLGTNDSIMLLDISYPKTVWLIMIYVIAYFECMFLSTVACTYLSTKYLPPFDRDYIIILGCGIRKDGGLTPLLKGRVDSAVAFEKKQYEQTGKHAVFVPSGGQGADEVMSESEAMKNYLLSIGIPQEQIILENKSENTMQNMQFSKKVIEEHGGEIKDRKIAFATTNYHVFRGYILARKNGFEAKGISAKTKSYFYFNAFLREFIGLLVDQKWYHIVYIMLIVALIVTLNLVR